MAKRVWEVCEPHPDVFARDMDPSMFAASLYAVESGTADADYTDAEQFFAKTFMTHSLKNVLEGVLARLLGLPGRGAPVLRLETPFGGGKTHTMVALYHLVRHAEELEATEVGQQVLGRLEIAHLPWDGRVAVLDGVALDPHGREVNGCPVRTLWGELAYALGGRALFESVRAADEARTAPGQVALAELLQRAAPVLILMDEVMHYLAKARAVMVGDSNLSIQTVAFLRELTAAVNEVGSAVLVLSLPASSLEVPAEDSARAEEMFQAVHKVLGRTELIVTPVAEDEVFGVLKRRLFRHVGEQQAAKQAVEGFKRYYNEFARFFPEKLRSSDYHRRMLHAYPFHPELVDLLYQHWSSHPQFQRTRGALRLLALVLRRLWNQRPGSAYLIQLHHIDLADRHIRAEVVRLMDGAFDAIASGDVLARAREIDRDLGSDYQKEELAKGAATCAYLYSDPSSSEMNGLTEEELRIALLRPGVNPALLSEVLGRLRSNLWYLRYRDQRYFFMSKANLNKVILDHEQGIVEERVDEQIAERLRAISGAGKSALQVIMAPTDEEAMSEPFQATLVLLPLHLSDPQGWMKRVVAKTTRRNLLIFLAPEKGGEGRLRAAVKRLLALEAVERAGIFRELDKVDQDEVKDQLKEKQAEVDGLLFSSYSRVFRPAPEGVQELRVSLKRDAKTLAEAVESVLREQGILIGSISPDYLISVLGAGERPVSLAEIETVLTGSPEQPVVAKPLEAIQQAVNEAVVQNKFAVIARGETFRGGGISESVLTDPDAKIVPIEQPPAPPPLEAETVPLRLTIEITAKNSYPLRKVLESIQSTDIKISVEIMDSTGDLARKRADLEKLLEDYSVCYRWSEGELYEDG